MWHTNKKKVSAMENKKRALIAMSGGVDSSVCAYLMKRDGYDCIGMTLRLFSNDTADIQDSTCCSLDDVNDAKAVAARLDIPHYTLNFTSDFKENVIDRFVSAYEAGATPNPCIDCNRYIKFSGMYQKAMELDADCIVTGHYARIEFDEKSGRYLLKKALDSSKDQSYVLYSLTQEQLAHTKFPLGELEKSNVRIIAEENGFINAHKKDSQDICFVPDGDYVSFIEKYTGKKYPCGEFVDVNGNVLGEHKGIIGYTIGQRKGLGLSLPQPMYVCRKCLDTNRVVLTTGEELFSSSLDAVDLNLISVPRIEGKMRVNARVRYNQKEQPATVMQTSENTIHVEFDIPQRAITAGQAVVLYDGETVVGGATII